MTDTTPTPTVALVHGAFADSAGWTDVVAQLIASGVRVQAVSNPLRGVAYDAAYVASAISQIPGPVLPVGHLALDLGRVPGPAARGDVSNTHCVTRSSEVDARREESPSRISRRSVAMQAPTKALAGGLLPRLDSNQ